MARICPYADPSARGTLAGVITFRRFRGKVRMGLINRPKNVKTSAQLSQRADFLAANAAYKLLTSESKEFYRQRGVTLTRQGRNLFFSAHLRDRIPSITPQYNADSVEDMVVFYPAGIDPDSIEISLLSHIPTPDTILWTKLESESEGDVSSEIGNDLVWSGDPSHLPGKFGNSAYCRYDVQSNHLAEESIFTIDPANCIITGFWFYGLFAYVDGVTIGYQSSIPINFYVDTLNRFGCDFSAGKYRTLIRVAGASTIWYPSTGITAGPGEWHHFLNVYDRAGIGVGTNRQRCYFDAQLNGNTTDGIPVTQPRTSWHLHIGAWNPVGSHNMNARIDNIKVINPAHVTEAMLTAILDNIQNEGYPIGNPFGNVHDNSNIFTQETPVGDYITAVKIENLTGNVEKIPFYYLCVVDVLRLPDDHLYKLLRLPKIKLEAHQIVYLYVSSDFSVYWDPGLTKLACTNKI